MGGTRDARGRGGPLMSRVWTLLRGVLHSFGRLQVERPWVVALLAFAMPAPAVLAARGLGLKTDFSELSPANNPSVVELGRVGDNITSSSTLTVAVRVAAINAQGRPELAD